MSIARVLRAATVGLVALAVAGTLPVDGVAVPAAARLQLPGDLVVRVDDVAPISPVATQDAVPLIVDLTLTNTTATDLGTVTVRGQRGDPIRAQTDLDTAITATAVPDSALDVAPDKPVTAAVGAGATVHVRFVTTIGQPDGPGVCQCDPHAVYPLYFIASNADGDLGSAHTFVPSFFATPADSYAKDRVSWVWPLIDRPHRFDSDTVFLDDDLAASVSAGGRLSRALQVVQDAGQDAAMTVVVDPELLDELEVMAAGKYTVLEGSKTARAGAGQDAATAWLDRFRTVARDDAAVDIVLTPYADPDVQTLSRNGLTWSTALPSSMATRVSDALGGRGATNSIAWPAAPVIGRATADRLVAGGVSSVILDSGAVAPVSDGGLPVPLAKITTPSGPLTTALSVPAVSRSINDAISLSGSGAAALPTLTARLGVLVAQDPTGARSVVMTPTRYVDPDPQLAARTVRETTQSPYATPVAISAAIGDAAPQAGRLQGTVSGALPGRIVRRLTGLSTDVSTLDSLLTPTNTQRTPTTAAATLLAALPPAVQRSSSSAWRSTADSGSPVLGLRLSRRLALRVARLLGSVHIVKPSSGTYTLASTNTPLPITVENTSDYSFDVQVSVTTVGGLPGFTAPIRTATVDAHSKRTLKIATDVQRSGRIAVQAQLLTTSGVPLGRSVPLSVHSTVFGVIGIVITVVAGAVLLLALLFRLRRYVKERRTGSSRRLGATSARSLARDEADRFDHARQERAIGNERVRTDTEVVP